MNVEVVRQKLVDGDSDAVLKELVDLYRRAEILHTPQLGRILEALFPVWKGLLHTKLPPQLRVTTPNRCRKVLLQILNRLPSNEALRPYVPQLLQLLMEVLQKDNEDNALIALKTLFDLHRNYRPGLRNEVQPFLELVQLMYKNLPTTMKKQFSGLPETHKFSAATTPIAAKSSASVASAEESSVSTGARTSASSTTGETATGVSAQPAQTGSTSTSSVDSEATTRDSSSGADAITDEPISSNLESFKTISELPLIIMLLFQCYPSYIESYIPVLVPLMMSALALRAPEAAPTTHPTRYLDFLDCQVKTLSFVTYLLRGCANMMRPFQDAICENTVKLLMACPKDAFVLRKDIFVAARHIISTDFRRGFYPQLELLMDDDVLVGKGRCSFYQIRPLAYSTLADMIHHVRDMLTLTQVSTIVDFYGKRIHDPTLPISIQTTSIRLLLNLVDISAKNEDTDAWKGRNILSRILLIISGKFGTTLDNLPMALATTLRNKSSGDRSDLLEGGAMDKIKQSSLLPKEVVHNTLDEKKLEALLLPYLRVQRPGDSVSEEEPSIRDIKSLLRTMILGIRAVIWCTANYRNPHAKDLSTVDANTMDGSGIVAVSTSQGMSSMDTVGGSTSRSSGSSLNDGNVVEHAYPLTDDERMLIAKVLRNGLRCFILYTLSENTVSEEKQMLDHFAGAFTVLEAADFRDLFISNIQLLYECILQDHAILTIPQHFLANSNVSCWFAEILLKFLITQMKDLSVEAEGDLPDTKRVDKVMTIESLEFENMRPVPQVHRASIVLRLFKIVFGSVTLFKSNESALFPHLRTIIESCLKQATFTKHPDNYLLLLRALFRSISGGKYENFYKEVFPLLPGVLSALMRLQKHIGKPAMREVLLELCLTIPARLSSLLQYLPSLMKSVVRAILSRGELAYLGLRTLEFWVDNLNPDFLYPIMTSQDRLLTEIIEALNTHLIPPPYPYGELAMRILGKIGGRNRQYLMDPLNLDYHDHSFTGLTFTFQWDREENSMDIDMEGDGVVPNQVGMFPMKMDALVSQATKVLRTYLRRTPVERGNVSKVDSRLVDVDEFEEGENLPGLSFLLEKDDQTLHLETETMAKIRGSILQHKRCAFIFVSRAAVVSFNTNDYAEANQEGDGNNQRVGELGAEHLKPMRKVISQEALRSTRKQLLEVLFETMADVDIGAEATKVVEGIAGHLTVQALAHCSREQPDFAVLSSLHASTLYAATRGLSPGRHLATTKRIETLRQATYGIAKLTEADVTNDFYAFAQVISNALSSSDQRVVDAGKRVLTFIVKTIIAEFPSRLLAVERGGGLFNSLCEVFGHACYDKGSWRQKLGGAIGLRLLVELLECQWCHENELNIIKALFFVLSDHPPEVSTTVSSETGETLVQVVKSAWQVRVGYADQLGTTKTDSDESKKKDFLSCVAFQDTEVFQMFVVEFLSPKAPSRQYAKQCITTIASLQETTASALLYPYNQLVSKQITGCNLRMLPSNTRAGYVDAMAYALSLKPPIFSLTKEIMVFLQEVWRLISEDSHRDGASMIGTDSPRSVGGATTTIPGSGVSAQEYPFGLSQACELRIAAAKLLRAAFLAAPNDLNNHPEYRNRFVGVFFRYLTGQPPELVQVAQEALTDVIQLNKQNKDVFLPKELLQQCLRPVLLNLADYRKLNLPLLEGLARLLTLLSSCFNVTLGEKLLEHLKQWRDPDRIIKAGIWKRGEEPAVAAAIVDLFHLLPPNDSFLEPLINCVVDLEAVLPKYGSYGKMSSPYRMPLTRFLNRYASSTISFFLKREHLVEIKYSPLFQQLIKLPEAAPLRAVIIKEGGAESLVEATFSEALKLNATGFGDPKGGADVSNDAKMQAQIQLNAQKAAAQAVANAQAQGMTTSMAEARGVQARAAYVVKAQAQVNAQQALKVQSQVQIQANAQKLHAQTLAAAQAQGLSLSHGLGSSLALGSSSSLATSGGPFASKTQQEALELHYQGLRLIRSITRVQRLVAHDRLPIKFHLESKLLIKCLVTYSRAKPDDVQVLLDMVSVFLHRTSFDFSFLQAFYQEEVAINYSAANKRSLIRLFLRMLREPGASEELKVYAVQLLIMPVLTTSFEDPNVNNIDVMDLDTVMWMLREILASKDSPETMQTLRIELLKLGTLLIQHMSKYVTDQRKEVIKFAWNHLKAHDLTSKLWAYVNVCRFISVYDTPPKIVLQVYVALLRTHEMDARFLVRKAFDILLPALPSRLPSSEFIKAIKWTKKIAYEEGHVLGQLVHIWFLIVRHPALFYPFRGQFVPLMVNSLNRLAIPPSSTPDNRRLAVNIVDLSKRPMPYVIQYAPRIMKLLEPCFDRQNHEIQASLTMFLRRMTELYPPSRAPQPLVVCKFYPWLREIINERLVNATMYQQDLSTMSGVGMTGGSTVLASKAKGKTTSQGAAGSKADKHGGRDVSSEKASSKKKGNGNDQPLVSEAATGAIVKTSSAMKKKLGTAANNMASPKELWVSLFSATWRLLKESEQTQVTGQLLKILASKYNKRDLNVPLGASTPRRTNVVQTLMKGIVSTSPSAPVMTPELVLHVASAYDVWSCATRLCEFQVEKSDLSVESRLRWIEALSAIYKQLSEDDLRIGLSLENIAQPETRTALTLEALGCVHEAQEEYFRALSKAQSGRVSVEDVNLFELRLWEERWVGCAKQLCQWQLMNDFAKSTQNQELLLDCAWKRGDWASAKQLLLSPSMQSSAELGCPQTRLQRLYISILDADKRTAIDALAAQTAELALHQWQGLPRILSRAHLPLMHLFHKFVEVKESIQMMEDIKLASAQHAALPNLKPSINTWRERLPNKWEPILLWDDILTWRSHMFQVVKTTFAWSDAQMLACMHDSPWSVIKLAHTARKQRLPDVCLGALAKLYSVPAMDVQDAFSKLREQVSICYESATEYSGGLSILNTTNLDYFSLRQKAEMFRLKALFLEAQGALPEANQTFSHCLQICDSYGKGWLSWGHYCYRLFLVRKELALASQTIACYLQAIHHRCNSARLMIARVLWLLNMDDRRGVLIQAFESHGKQLPIWIWIIWIPQLLMALGRPEAPQIRGLLRGLSAKFPQALYYTMRAFFLENRDNAMALANQQQQLVTATSTVSPSSSAATQGETHMYYRTKSGHVVGVPSTMSVTQVQDIPGLVGPPRPTPAAFNAAPAVVLTLEAWNEKVRSNGGDGHVSKAEVGPVQYTEDLLNFLRRSHDSLTFEMECMLEEMITRFRPEPEEELLTAVHALLLKCYQLPRLTKTEPVPKMLRAALARVCRKLFVLLPHQKNEKHEAFVAEFKDAFERDFTPLGGDVPQQVGPVVTLYEIMNRLKRWKSLLQLRVKKVGKRNAGKLYLERCSRHLMELSSSNMEVPGQYVSDSEPIKDLHARIQHFESTVDVLLRNGFTQRRVAMGGSDGRAYYFLVQYAMTHITRTDERMMQMYLLLNRLLLRHKETKKRNTVFHVPKVIPLTPRVRLLEDNRDFVTLGEIYELDCQIENTDPDLPVELYRERVSEAYAAAGAVNDSTQQEDERVAQAKARAFHEICNEHVPETLLAKYVHGISAHSDAYFQFRSEFTKHLALSSFLSYALFVGDRAPHRVLFSRRTGRVVSTELRPGYASSGILEAATAMPFRLTRNLHSFMTRPGVQGPFSVGMTAAAEALMSEEDILSNQLCLFFRDDLLSWHASKTRLVSLDSQAQAAGRVSSPAASSGATSPSLSQRRVESQVQQRVEANVSLVLERIRGVSLKKESGESARGKSVRELLEIATSPERQREMYPTWYPWL
ncbi:hypothetical protein BBJ29_003112 [Phytophthora kernoviae]|uniref:Non-specific serine/threonine protein kinase n=1 Tax=Phytophthora kernoviae TaxID=325452 RepID=A0A421G1I1_9STRA|nr:hypothetical protein BBJ29_003112 [Phytophthora kernoviae]